MVQVWQIFAQESKNSSENGKLNFLVLSNYFKVKVDEIEKYDENSSAVVEREPRPSYWPNVGDRVSLSLPTKL